MFGDAPRTEFDRTGILKLESAFGEGDAARMRDLLWTELGDRYGIDRGARETWNRHPPTGLKSTKKRRAFDPICGAAVVEALDALLGAGHWDRPKQYGNVLVTMPNATSWRVPHHLWHSDFESTAPTDDLFAVKLWALLDDVAPGGGGTPQIAGSHRLFARYLAGTDERRYKRTKFGFLDSHPWLRELTTDDGDPKRNARFMDVESDLDGIPAWVVELTGCAGDVFITHGWVFHSIAENASDRPRLMRSVAVRRRPHTPVTSSGSLRP